MAWFGGKVSLGGFPDLAGAVNKFSESVKNIEKNFDNALGFDEKSDADAEASGLWPSASDRKALFDPVMTFIGNKGEDSVESAQEPEVLLHPPPPRQREGSEADDSSHSPAENAGPAEEAEMLKSEREHIQVDTADGANVGIIVRDEVETDPQLLPTEHNNSTVEKIETAHSLTDHELSENSKVDVPENSQSMQAELGPVEIDQAEGCASLPLHQEDERKVDVEEMVEELSERELEPSTTSQSVMEAGPAALHSLSTGEIHKTNSASEVSENSSPTEFQSDENSKRVLELVSHEIDAIVKEAEMIQQSNDHAMDIKEHLLSTATSLSKSDSVIELQKTKVEMKMMETALQGAARQAQAKADEIAKLMNENEQLKSVIEDLKRKSNEAEVETLREEYHQRVAALERKVYALTKERDTLRREQNRKSDAAALLKEKDEIINQVMAEGEELSKKQAAQESQIRKLRAQTRELEEEKKGLLTKLQVEENKVESIKRDKAATEMLLQETIEKHQAELAAQKDYFTNALALAKEAESLAEARANNEARNELESRLREAQEREGMLIQTLEELRQTITRMEQQAVFREDMLHREIEDLHKRYQASERRCEELITQVPESTRPLLRQIEAMQETTGRRAEAWAAVERSLNSRLQEAEAKAAAAEERMRSVNERLSQTLSRTNVLEAQISCLRAEQSQLSRSLEKERQRAAENRQEHLAVKEVAETHEGRASQLEEELRELRRKHKDELQDLLVHKEQLQREVDREKTARMDLERTANVQSSAVSVQTPTKSVSAFENGNLARRTSSVSSLGSIEESYFLQASLDSSDSYSDRRNLGELSLAPYYMKSMTPSTFESALRQKDGELASYMSRLASLEAIRDSLAEELVKLTAECEKLRIESAVLPGLRAELEALRRRHSAALELMGERDEELEELHNDIADLKEMYREQVNLLVNKIQTMSSSMNAAV